MQLSLLDEIIELPVVQRVPDSGAGMLGVASLRGSLVTVYDPGSVLNVRGTLDGVALLFTRDDRLVALAVDDVHDAIVVDESEVRPAPGVGSDGVLIGVIRRGDQLIALVDGNALIESSTAVREGEPG